MKQEIILTVGISNSGKTTWANKFCEENPNFANINRDDIRAMLYGNLNSYIMTTAKEKKVTMMVNRFVNAAVQNDELSVIISDTNLNYKTRDTWKKFAKDNSLAYSEKVFDAEPHICIARSYKRDYTVPANVINRQYLKMREYLGKPTYTPNENHQKVILVDIDGTVANCNGVLSPFDMTLVVLDKPIDSVIELVNMYHAKGYKVIFMSGRSDICEKETLKWLTSNNLPVHELHMRKDGDFRPDTIVKEELFFTYITNRYNVRIVIDDRNQVVSRWRALGLKCLQVSDGDF